MRIALFTETFLPKVDGIVTRLKHTVEHLQKQGHDVLSLSLPKADSKNTKGQKLMVLKVFPYPCIQN